MNVKLFDDGHSNVEYENDQMSSINLFDVRHLNDKCQNDLNVQLFDVQHSDVECQNDTNVKL